MVTNPMRRLRRPDARIDATCRRREDLAQRDLLASDVLRLEQLEVGADETAKEGSANIVRVAFCLVMSDKPRSCMEQTNKHYSPIIKQKSNSLSGVRWSR